jgi:hypothetical protein
MCVRQVPQKTNIFCGLCKKEKIYIVKSNIFCTEICLFYTRHIINRFFYETTLWPCSTWRCTYKIFVSIFLKFKICVTCIFKIVGAYAPMFQNTTPDPHSKTISLWCQLETWCNRDFNRVATEWPQAHKRSKRHLHRIKHMQHTLKINAQLSTESKTCTTEVKLGITEEEN